MFTHTNRVLFDSMDERSGGHMNRAESNTAIMKQFEIMINTADEALSRKLISEKASFFTPASPVPLYGGKGYLSVVH